MVLQLSHLIPRLTSVIDALRNLPLGKQLVDI